MSVVGDLGAGAPLRFGSAISRCASSLIPLSPPKTTSIPKLSSMSSTMPMTWCCHPSKVASSSFGPSLRKGPRTAKIGAGMGLLVSLSASSFSFNPPDVIHLRTGLGG